MKESNRSFNKCRLEQTERIIFKSCCDINDGLVSYSKFILTGAISKIYPEFEGAVSILFAVVIFDVALATVSSTIDQFLTFPFLQVS